MTTYFTRQIIKTFSRVSTLIAEIKSKVKLKIVSFNLIQKDVDRRSCILIIMIGCGVDMSSPSKTLSNIIFNTKLSQEISLRESIFYMTRHQLYF